MRLKSVDKIFGKYSLCFSVKSTDEVNFSGWIKSGTAKIKITPIHNSNMLDLDNALYELIEGENPEEFIGKEFYE